MAGEIENFGNKGNTNGFTQNPGNAGRKKKLFRHFNDDLKKKGYEPLTREQLIEAYSLIFNTDEEELLKLIDDKKLPFVLKIIIKELKDKNSRSKAISDYRDYMFGKAINRNEDRQVDKNGEDLIIKTPEV